MICEHCGTEHALGADYVCRDVLKTQLASMTKRAEVAERGALETIKAHATEKIARLAAEAKLATAVEGLREIAGRALSYAGWAAECARSTLRALGIDVSKDPTECKHCRIPSSVGGWLCPFCHQPNREPVDPSKEKGK